MKINYNLSPYDDTLCFRQQELNEDDVQSLLQAALLSMESVRENTCELYVTDDKVLQEKLVDVRDFGADSIRQAPLSIAIVADRLYDGAWVENCSSALWAINLKAAELGLLCKAVQIRGYSLSDGTMSDDAVRGILGIPEGKTVYALVGVGYASSQPEIGNVDDLCWEKVHLV